METDVVVFDALIARVNEHFAASIQTKIHASDTLFPVIVKASELIVQALLAGQKILSCGNGGSACEALHFAAEMLNRFKQERPALPAIALVADVATLTAIANDYQYSDIFSKQIRALGHMHDLLLAISTSGCSPNIINAIKAAHDKKMTVIALSGANGGQVVEYLKETDIEIRIPSTDTARIQETHLLIIHCLCDLVEHRLFGQEDITYAEMASPV